MAALRKLALTVALFGLTATPSIAAAQVTSEPIDKMIEAYSACLKVTTGFQPDGSVLENDGWALFDSRLGPDGETYESMYIRAGNGSLLTLDMRESRYSCVALASFEPNATLGELVETITPNARPLASGGFDVREGDHLVIFEPRVVGESDVVAIHVFHFRVLCRVFGDTAPDGRKIACPSL